MTLKEMQEKRNEIVESMKAITEKANVEERAVDEAEAKKFNDLDVELRSLESSITVEERSRDLKLNVVSEVKKTELSQEEVEVRSFANYIRDKAGIVVPVEERAGEQNVDMGNNGAIIPETISQMIVKRVADICPIFAEAMRYSVKGTLKVPVWGDANTDHNIAVGYQAEFTELTADAGKFTSVDLTGFLAGALTLIGKSVVNNSAIDVVNFVVNYMAEEIAIFLDKELLVGTGSSAAQGMLVGTTNTLNAGSISAITADNLIDLQGEVKTVFQANAKWTMHPATWTKIRKLKDSTGNYLVQPGLNGDNSFRLLGKPVELSDNMPEIASAAKAVLYGDYKALSVNMRENVEIQILTEKYATQHAIGVVAWFEFDSKVTDSQKAATLVMSV